MSLPLISEFGMKFENFLGVEGDSLEFPGVFSKNSTKRVKTI